jgi:hypothetical protein
VDEFFAAIINQSLVKTAATGVVANDRDPDGDTLQALLVSGPGHGTLTLNSDGSFTYRSHPGFAGYDYFQYTAGDGQLESDVATVRVEVIGPVFPPTGTNDLYQVDPDAPTSVSTDAGVLRNDIGPDGATLTAVLFEGPQHGALLLQTDGSFAYTPNSGFTGQDGFAYRVYDGNSYSRLAAVTIRVWRLPSS